MKTECGAPSAALCVENKGFCRDCSPLGSDFHKTKPWQGEAFHRNRRKTARKVIKQGGNMRRFAEAEGITPPAAHKWLTQHAPDLHRLLLDGRHESFLTPERRDQRLEAVAKGLLAGKTRRTIARSLGISGPALHQWLGRGWAEAVDELIAEMGEAA